MGLLCLGGSPPNVKYLEGMGAYLAQIGPDLQTVFVDGAFGVVQAHLAGAGDKSPSTQPCRIGRYAVFGDVRFDRRLELNRALGVWSQVEVCDDAQLLLQAWIKWGQDALNRISGDFSAVIWDSETRAVFCIRDQIGIKPFFYVQTGNLFLFSNALEGIARHPGISRSLDENYLADFLAFGYPADQTVTVYKQIKRLAPAHSLEFLDGRLKLRKYWSLATEGDLGLKSEEYPLQFAELLEDSVRDRLPRKSAGVLMSGGLDSTAVASMARSVGGCHYELDLYTLDAREIWSEDREAAFASEAAEYLGARHKVTEIDQGDMFQNWQLNSWAQPEPVRYSFWHTFLKLLRQMAVTSRVGFTGQGGDGLLTSSPNHFSRLMASRQWGEFASDFWQYYRLHSKPPPLGIRSSLKGRYERHPERPVLAPWFKSGFLKRTGLIERFHDLAAGKVGAGVVSRSEAYYDLSSPVWPAIIGRLDAQMTGVPYEFRHPFLDLRLVEFVLSMPAVPWFENKALLRHAMVGKLPESVRLRKKVLPRLSPAYTSLQKLGPLHADTYLAELAPLEDILELPVLAQFLRNPDKLKADEADMTTLPIAVAEWLAGVELSDVRE